MEMKKLNAEEYICRQMEELDKKECDLNRHRVRVGYLKALNRRQANVIAALRAGLEDSVLDVSIQVPVK